MKHFYTVANTVKHNLENILNFFNNRHTNANAESFNSKIELFRANLRGVTDTKFFLFRLHKLFAYSPLNKNEPKFVLQFNKALTQDVRVRVLSVVGKEMITPIVLTSGTTTSKAISLNSNIANGMYMIVLEGDNANYTPIKLVVNR